MFAKFLLIALVCVSVAQVQGGRVDNAINNSLRRARVMDENARARHMEATRDVDRKKLLIFDRTEEYVEKANRVKDSSRQTLRNVAFAMTEKAQENGYPDTVFQCILRTEERANNEIEAVTRKFATDMDRLERTKVANINTASDCYPGLLTDIEVKYTFTVVDLQRCENIMCVNSLMSKYSSVLKSFYAKLRRVEEQTGTAFGNYQRDASNYFSNSNSKVSKIRSNAIRNIRNCYYRGDRPPYSASEESQESQESQA